MYINKVQQFEVELTFGKKQSPDNVGTNLAVGNTSERGYYGNANSR